MFKQTLEIVVKGKKISMEYDKRSQDKNESINNDYQFYEDITLKTIVELIKNRKIEYVLIHNGQRNYQRFREIVFELAKQTGLGWKNETADKFSLNVGIINPSL